ncbi:cold shock domain-containing protein [Aeromonas caviae]|uniref:cold shock domain-containing protein n=1 Tax=Aeromonas caviae TaxID=648 RepID=UPI002B48AEC2|nr:cold shock domain-containing protein [Aeromonas caviae]
MKGKVTQWNDGKGFGFITPEDGSEKIFFHISAVNPNDRRPQINDEVLFETDTDSQRRVRATEVYYEGWTLRPIKQPSKQSSRSKGGPSDKKIILEPVRKTPLDYVFLILAIVLIAFTGFKYYKEKDLAISLPIALFAMILLALFSRPKKPSKKFFTCSRCRCNAPFNNRTIRAWNTGTMKLYCSNCHAEWLSNRETTNNDFHSSSNRGSGCLGVLVMMIVIPVGLVSIASWLS